MKTHQLLILLLTFLCTSSTIRAEENYMFKHIETKDGLSHSQITTIFKDSRGFMWFGTAGGGLNRYDGYNYKVFHKDEKVPTSLTDNYIQSIEEDIHGNLWIGTGSGYCIYLPQKETFIRDANEELKKLGINEGARKIFIDNEKNIWSYAPEKGVYKYQPKDATVLLFPINNTGNITSINVKDSTVLFLFNNGELIIADNNNPQKQRLENYISTHQPLISEKYTIFIDRDSDWWIYSKDAAGVWWYSQKANKWELLNNRKQGHSNIYLKSSVVQGITQDQSGNIWIATDHGGINIIKKGTDQVENLLNDIADERSIAYNSINSVYCDDLGIVWAGTYKKGISYYNESVFKFAVDHLGEFKNIPNFDCDITIIEEDKNGDFWLGTNGSGLVHIDRKTGKKTLFKHNPNDPHSISSDVIVSLHSAKDGTLWIGTYLGGLNYFDGKRFGHYKHQANNPNSIANDKIWDIKEDRNGNLWIGTLGNGVQMFNPTTKEFTSYHNKVENSYISSLCVAKDGTIYIGTSFGLAVYHPKTGVFENLYGNRANTQEFSNQNINQVFEDSRGLIWIATVRGISILDPRSDKIIVLTTNEGLVNNIVNAIVEDNNKTMWVTTSNGISNITVQTDNKNIEHRFTFNNYDEADGLQDREFNMRSALHSSKGEILIGGINGYNIFQPESIKYNNRTPEISFTELKLFNKTVEIDSVYNGNKILSKAFSQTDKITLKHYQNAFTISFSGMNYILPEKNIYQYKLEGFSNKWHEVDGATHSVRYTGLPYGNYTLKVKAANSDGFWGEECASLEVVILPPFWQTGWAYCIYGIVIIGLLLLARWLVLRNERSKFRLEQVKQEAEHKHQLDDMKLRFFTNISHEFRTPLTLIITPLQKMIEQSNSDEQKKKLELVKRNATRLLYLVNQLLDFRKQDVSQHHLTITVEDIVPFASNICQSFMELTDRKHISLTFHSCESSIKAEFDMDKLEKIILNLLSNAFKFTEEGGSVSLQMRLIEEADQQDKKLEIRVIDTGKGVSDEDKAHIFERFYQSNNNDNSVTGTGIGLHMTKEFVTLHGGTIHVEDNPQGKGSIFVVVLPVIDYIEEQNESTTDSHSYTTTIEDTLRAVEDEEMAPDDAPTILLVDDNNDFRAFIKECLQAKYKTVEATNGVEAWKLIPDLQPDLIISDVMMPEMDGNQLSVIVKNDMRTSHIPVILLTARTADEQKIEGLETGADDYITKPFNLEILLLRINKLLEMRKERQESFTKQIEPKPKDITITSLDEKLIARAIDYVEKNIDRSDLSVEELSNELGMSRVHLYKKLTAITGRAPLEFIRVIRLKRAAQLLRESQLNISEIAYSVGFNNPKYFSRYFKEEFNVLPSEYKNQNQLVN